MRRHRENREIKIGVVIIGTIAALIAAILLFATAPSLISDGMTQWRLGIVVALMVMPIVSLLAVVALQRLVGWLLSNKDA